MSENVTFNQRSVERSQIYLPGFDESLPGKFFSFFKRNRVVIVAYACFPPIENGLQNP